MAGLMPGLDDQLKRGRRKDEEGNSMPVHWQFSRKMKNGERVFGDEFLKGKSFVITPPNREHCCGRSPGLGKG